VYQMARWTCGLCPPLIMAWSVIRACRTGSVWGGRGSGRRADVATAWPVSARPCAGCEPSAAFISRTCRAGTHHDPHLGTVCTSCARRPSRTVRRLVRARFAALAADWSRGGILSPPRPTRRPRLAADQGWVSHWPGLTRRRLAGAAVRVEDRSPRHCVPRMSGGLALVPVRAARAVGMGAVHVAVCVDEGDPAAVGRPAASLTGVGRHLRAPDGHGRGASETSAGVPTL